MTDASELARRWMRGTREGNGRPSWEHPADVVRLIGTAPADYFVPGATDVAWLHDIIEDGVREDGSPVTGNDLRAAGASVELVRDVLDLTRQGFETKVQYLERLPLASRRARFVKCCDRICNLREGRGVFSPARWERYVVETGAYIVPLAHTLDAEAGTHWLTERIEAAMLGRPEP